MFKYMNYSVHNKAIFIINNFLFLFDTGNTDKLLHLRVFLDNNDECGRRSTQPLREHPTKEYNHVSDNHQDCLLLCTVWC